MIATGLLLLLALADSPLPAATGAGSETLTEASLGPGYTGYGLFDPGLARVRQLDPARNYGPYLMYRMARDVVESHDACLQGNAANRAQIEAAYQQIVSIQRRHVSAAQWHDLQEALRAGRTRVPERTQGQCAAFVDNAPYFDAGLDDALLGAAELAREKAGEGDTRSDALRPVLGVQMGGGGPD